MASTDARPVPRKNVAMRITFPLRDVNGDLVTGATGLDSEVSKDGGTFADCTNEATEIATSSGIYYLDLTSTEMNADTVAVIVKSSAKTFAIVMYPEEAGDMRSDVTHWNGTAVSTPATAGIPDVNVKNIDNDAASASGTVTFPNATLASTTNITAGTITTATNVTTVNGLAANVITAASINTGAITSAKFAAGAIDAAAIATDAVDADALAGDAATEIATAVWAAVTRTLTANTNLNDPTAAAIADAVWDEARSGHVTAGSFGEGVLVQTVNANALNTNSFSTGCISAAAIAANAIGATELAADAVTEIVDGVWANATRTLTADTNINYPSAATVAAAVMAAGDIDGYTLEQFGKLCLAALVGKLSGAATTTNTVRAADDSKDRITATVDADGNRTAVTLDAAG